MKKYFVVLILLIISAKSFCQDPSWVTTNDSSFYPYSFSLPGVPAIKDTLNIKHYFYALDTSIGFQVLEFKYAKFDSTNVTFSNALTAYSGDTLTAITSAIFNGANSTVLTTHTLEATNGYKGVEVAIQYNNLNHGRVVLAYARFLYRKDFFLTFTITGFQDELSILNVNKVQFFNSISF